MKKLTHLLAVGLVVSFSQTIFAAENVQANLTGATTAPSTTTSSSAAPATTTTATTTAQPKAISMSALLQQLQKAGYIVKSVDYNKDDNQFKVEAVDKHGDKQSLDVTATGLSADQKKSIRDAAIAQIVKKMEKSGTYIKSLSMDNGTYKVTTVDNKGNEQNYTVDMTSGKVSQ